MHKNNTTIYSTFASVVESKSISLRKNVENALHPIRFFRRKRVQKCERV